MKTWFSRLKSEKYKYLVDILILISLCQFLIMAFGFKAIEQKNSILYDSILRVSGMITFFLLGCAGLVIMIRQEFRQLVIIRGRLAQVAGFILWIINWYLVLAIARYIIVVSRTGS